MRAGILVAAVAVTVGGAVFVSASAMPLIRFAASEARTLERAQAKNSETTSDYVRDAAIGDRFEIAAAKIAEERGRNRDVRHFARMMIRDHNAASAQLKATLQRNDIDIALPDALDQEHVQMLQDLHDASARDFDERYIDTQIQEHEEALELHNTYAQNGDNAFLKRFAAETAPKVRAHLHLAHALEARHEHRTASVR